jgi:DNA gyrase subunit A
MPDNEISIVEEMEKDYALYAMAAITDRAIPFLKDGLKPVQRRVLFVMGLKGLTSKTDHAKVAEVVGETMGHYHPHGDQNVSDALYRMGQPWIMRYPLIDPQGNFGSRSGLPPAAPRYTECRLTRAGEFMLLGNELDKEVLPFVTTYNEKREEPVYLPGLFPNILCNPQEGVAPAAKTSLVPHNLREVVKAIKLLAHKPDASIKDIMKVMPGPDFPTGGYILGNDGIKDYYETGSGYVDLQGKVEVYPEPNGVFVIAVTQLPFGCSESKFQTQVEALVGSKALDVTDLRSLTDKNGMRIEVELAKGADPNVALNVLYKKTGLRSRIYVLNNVILNGNLVLGGMRDIIQGYITHRLTVILKRSQLEMSKAEARIHVLEALVKAVDKLDRTLKTIRGSKNREEARQGLVKLLRIDEGQANAILDRPLASLTKMAVEDLRAEADGLKARIKELKEIVTKEPKRIDVMCDELDAMEAEIGDDRISEIRTEKPEEIKVEDLIEREEVAVIVSRDGYVKRVPMREFRVQRRGGKGTLTAQEEVSEFFVANTHDDLLLFTDDGNYYRLKVHEIAQSSRQGKGSNLRQVLGLAKEAVVTASIIDRGDSKESFLISCTDSGMIKRTAFSEYGTKRSDGVTAMKLLEGDRMRWVALTDGRYDIFMATRGGLSIRFSEDQIATKGRVSLGVKSIKLDDGDEIVSFSAFSGQSSDVDILSVSETGFGKRTEQEQFRQTSRTVRGVVTMNLSEETGGLVASIPVRSDQNLMLLTRNGKAAKIKVDSIKRYGRSTRGVRIVSLDDGDSLVGAIPINDNVA